MKRERENGARELPSGVGVTALMRVMTIARRLFRNTWVQRLAITSNLYRALLWLGFRSRVYDSRFRGHCFRVPSSDITIFPSMVSNDFERLQIDVFSAVLASLRAERGRLTVLDVGANIGIYSVVAASEVGSEGHVYAFEPVRANVSLLRENLQLNGTPNVTVVQSAVGAAPGQLRIYLAEPGIGTHSAGAASSRFEEVSVVSIDPFTAMETGKIE